SPRARTRAPPSACRRARRAACRESGSRRSGRELRHGSSRHLFFGRELARFFLEHYRDAVFHRIRETVRLADQLGGVLAVDELALAQGADQDFKQLWIDATHHFSSAAKRRRSQFPNAASSRAVTGSTHHSGRAAWRNFTASFSVIRT